MIVRQNLVWIVGSYFSMAPTPGSTIFVLRGKFLCSASLPSAFSFR